MRHQAPDKSLPERIMHFFRDQLAWHEHVLEELSRIQQHLDNNDLETLEKQRSLYGSDIARMEKQLGALQAEWQNTPKPNADVVNEIRALARQAESMAARVAAELERASSLTDTKASKVRTNLQKLRQGRKIFTGYRQDYFDPGFIDERI